MIDITMMIDIIGEADTDYKAEDMTTCMIEVAWSTEEKSAEQVTTENKECALEHSGNQSRR